MSFWEYGPRKKAAGGVAARSRKGAIGDTWWSKRFVNVLEAITGGGRIQRGRTYARAGQVSDLVLVPGLVTARVQGSRPEPYTVAIRVTPLTDTQWTAAEDALASQALFAAALLAGEMPHEIEGVFTGLGTPIFPAERKDLETSCTCPDVANPCKHVAAACYLLAERFDEDPFAILAWRGRDREALVAALRARRTGDEEPLPEPEVEAEAPIPLDASFWAAGDVGAGTPWEGADPTLLLKELGPLASGGTDLAGALGPTYEEIARFARGKLREE